MGSWPFTRLHYVCNRCIAISGPNIQVLDTTSGAILRVQRCASNISCSVVDEACTWLITVGEDKRLSVWKLEDLELQSWRELPKKATAVQLSPDAQNILVADKFGDVFSYPRIPPADFPAQEPKKRDAVASHATPHGSLILGHASIINALLLTHDGRYVITADRDEHIRVSRFPQGYIIERYCLGHRLFVSTLCLPAFEHPTLVSGGGDDCLHIWDWFSGTLRCEIPVVEAVRPFLRVQVSKPRWHRTKEGSRKVRKRQRKEQKESDNQLNSSARADAMEVLEEVKEPTDAFTELVFAVSKIVAVDFNGERVLAFSAFGASALFYCSYPLHATDVPAVRHVEFPLPVLDFAVSPGQHGGVLVSLDITWTPSVDTEDELSLAMRALSWQDGALKPCTETLPLVDTLNGAGLLDASAAELASLELYAALSLLPKHADGGEDGESVQDTVSRPGPPSKRSKPAGRLKTKQALLQQEEQERGSEEPVPKKMKVETGEV